MSKLALFLIVPATAAVGGLALWNLDLQSQLEELRTETAEVREAPERGTAEASSARAVRSNERAQTRVRELEQRLVALEARPFEASAASAGAAADVDAAAAEQDVAQALATADVTAAFRAKVHAVLEEREAERREQRRLREGERITQGLLRGLDVPEDQQAQVLATMLGYLKERTSLRTNEDLLRDDRQARLKEMDETRDRTLEGILGAETFAGVQERRERAGRRGGRTRSPRGQIGGRRRAQGNGNAE